MAKKLTRIYQDIDGCLNADYNARAWRQEGDSDDAGFMQNWVFPEFDDRGGRVGVQGIRYRMKWNSRLIDALNSLDVEFVWTTTWREDALKVGAVMNLIHDPQRVLHPLNGRTEFPSIHWKYDAIVEEQKRTPSPFISIDDEWSSLHPDVVDSLENLGGLVISPDPNFGVTPKDIQKMRKYIDTRS